jgi:hypothetical protein
MFTIQDFVAKFEHYTDEELMAIHVNLDGYSQEAQEALNLVIGSKGGMEALVQRLEQKKTVEREIQRIRKETASFGGRGVDATFIKQITSSDILPADKVAEIIESGFAEVEIEIEDKKIKSRTIIGSLIGALIASVVGGVLWRLVMIYAPTISIYITLLLLIGLTLFCYGVIKVSTKQTKRNIIVLVATIISIILAIFIGSLLSS